MQITPKRALISVSDKTGVIELAKFLNSKGVELLSTGGTFKAIADAWIPVTKISDYTGQQEILGGRVKSLHPRIFGGILGDVMGGQLEEMTAHCIKPIDLLVVNLYPFRETLAKGADFSEIIENIDIGGPAMVRAAAKNHKNVCLLTDPKDYSAFIKEWCTEGGISLEYRKRYALKAFSHTASYDADIAAWFCFENEEPFPQELSITGHKRCDLRYGENPQQKAAWYQSHPQGLSAAQLVQGKALSYNNLSDAQAALSLITEFDQPACAIIKHNNPCGFALGAGIKEAYQKALACDAQAAFGGIVAVNKPLDEQIAKCITQLFTEVVIAPDASNAAQEVLKAKPNVRLLLVSGMDKLRLPERCITTISGGFLVQESDTEPDNFVDWTVVSQARPDAAQLEDLKLAWIIAKHVKSNAIVLVKNGATVGIGAGQMSRVDAARLAVQKAGARANHAVAGSDAFFPFVDAVEILLKARIKAFIQPGGAKRDAQVIKEVDEEKRVMIHTAKRHFSH